MYHEETDTPALARTSDLNEELGQVSLYHTVTVAMEQTTHCVARFNTSSPIRPVH